MRALGSTGRRFDEPNEPNEQGVLELQCWRDYLLEFEPDEPNDVPSSALVAEFETEPKRVTVNFGDYVGEVRLGAQKATVASAKLDSEGFDRLLTDITDRISDLPFDFNSPAYIPFGRGGSESREVLYHAFVYLRWAMSDECRRSGHRSLKDSWAQLAADPHRTLVRSERSETPWDARGISPRTLEKIASHPELWQRVPADAPAHNSILARALEDLEKNRYIPEKVVELIAETCLDNPENRFARHFARTVANIATRACDVLSKAAHDPSLAEQASDLARSTQLMEQAHFLREVGELQHFPASSQVLQKRGPYRDLLRHHQALRLASSYPISGDDLKLLIEAKSASTLYEYWCFFKTAAALEGLLGPARETPAPAVDELHTDLARETRLRFPDRTELLFNLTFRRSLSAWPSYSVTLRPDIVLRTANGLHLFDAKFRIQTWDAEEATDTQTDEAEAADKAGRASTRWWKNADIHKMHAYRDALSGDIGRVGTVWVLYPGNKFVFYEASGRKLMDASELAPGMTGVGAIPLDPGADDAQLRQVVSALLG